MESATPYDALWRTEGGDLQRHGPVHRHLRKEVVRTVRALEVRSVLDVGCGSGENLAALAALSRLELTGLDVSAEALEIARRRVPSVRTFVLDIERGRLPEQFDLVMGIQVAEHLPDDVAAFANMAKMSRRYVLVSTLLGRMRRSELAIGHVRNYTLSELTDKLGRAGLRVVRTWCWGFPFYTPLYRSVVEWIPGGPPRGPMGAVGRCGAWMLYQLYRLNVPGRGEVVNVLTECA